MPPADSSLRPHQLLVRFEVSHRLEVKFQEVVTIGMIHPFGDCLAKQFHRSLTVAEHGGDTRP
jgi:hypothetical protein